MADDPTPAAANHTRNLPVPASSTPERDGFLVRLARALFGWKPGLTREDISVAVESAVPGETGVSPEERTMLRNILTLRERRIEDVMVPRADIVAAQQDTPLGELIKVFQTAGHSRLVVYNDTLDDPIGIVHIRDLIAFMAEQAALGAQKNTRRKKPLPAGLDLKAVDLAMPLSAAKIMREILYVPPTMPVFDLFAKMQATRIHLALVVDEYGGTDGLVTLEDIVEQVVGDISDEHDEDTPPSVIPLTDGSFIADARASLEDVTAAVGPEFAVGDAAEAVDTIGGYLMARGGRLPLRGELVAGPAGFDIEVLDADPRRIKRVRIHRSTDRPVERDREGRRRYSTPNAASPAISPDQSRPGDGVAAPEPSKPQP